MEKIDINDVVVTISHPHGDLDVPLTEWQNKGPGVRDLIKPIAAKRLSTGTPLPLSVVPMRYRNTTLSRFLIVLGVIDNPWPSSLNDREK